jgi:hypothetical protein
MDDRLVNRKSDLRDGDHRLPLGDRHRMGCLGVDDQMTGVKMAVNLYHRMNDSLDDHLMDDGHRDVLVGHRTNVTDDRNDLMMVVSSDVNLCHRMNDRLDDLNLVASHVNRNCVRRDQKMGVNRVNRNCAPHDLNLVVMTDVNRGRHRNVTNDQSLVASHGNRSCALRDLKTDENLDVSRGLHMNDLLDDHSMDDGLMMDGNLCHRMSGQLDDLNLVASRVNRNCVRRDRKTDVNLDVMSRRVKLMVYLSKSCDRMSHDHLRYDRQMMRHRDKNRMDGMILGGKMKIHHVIHRMKVYRMRLNRANHLMMVCRMKI